MWLSCAFSVLQQNPMPFFKTAVMWADVENLVWVPKWLFGITYHYLVDSGKHNKYYCVSACPQEVRITSFLQNIFVSQKWLLGSYDYLFSILYEKVSIWVLTFTWVIIWVHNNHEIGRKGFLLFFKSAMWISELFRDMAKNKLVRYSQDLNI